MLDISGIKKGYLKTEIEKLETNSNLKNVKDLYGGLSDMRRVTSVELIH